MAFNPRSLVLSKLSIILSSSLAHNNDPGRLWGNWTINAPPSTNHSEEPNGTCHDPCADLNKAIQHETLVLAPLGIALLFGLAAALPTLLCRSKHRIAGVKSFLWVLVQLWVCLLITHFLYVQRKDKAQAYVWALHSASHALASWTPAKRVLSGAHWVLTSLGAACVSLFAWQYGPPVGLAAWFRKGDALCGWSVHLLAILGVELLQWVLGPFEMLLMRA
jgi:hypothetical protein